ncbi:MAG: peptidoglycan DD-metalloendopeptidase family protein [Eubacteriales bacterium]
MEYKKEPDQIKEKNNNGSELRKISGDRAIWAAAAARAEERLKNLEKDNSQPVTGSENTVDTRTEPETISQPAENPGKPEDKEKKPEKNSRNKKKKTKDKRKKEKTGKTKENKKKEKKKSRKKKKEQPGFFGRIGRKFVNGGAALVEFHDRIQGACDRFFASMGFSLVKEYDSVVRRYKRSSRQIYGSLFSMFIITCAMLLVFEHFTAYQYAYNGRVLGYVKSQNDVVNVLKVAGNKLSSSNKAHIKFTANDNIKMNKVSVFNRDMDTPDQVVNKLTYMTDIEVSAVAICQDGKLMTIVENQQAADDVIKRIKESYQTPNEGMKITKTDFETPVDTKEVQVMLTSVGSKGDALHDLTEGGTIEIRHIVNEGETVNSIAKEFNVSPSDIKDMETGETVSKAESGSRVRIQKKIDPLKVITIEKGTTTETIPFETEEKQSADLYKDETYVQQEGADGRQAITGTITKKNGKEIKRDISKKEVIKEPVKKIVLIGTKERPKTDPTGTFATPIRGATITSEFGARWGRMHEGIDYGAATGTPIYASDGGTVTLAGVYGGYGNCVEIKHSGGYSTRYGHMSRFAVSQGEKVYQGQVIGYVGNTGRSTGSHLHFEVRLNGVAQNPRNYV